MKNLRLALFAASFAIGHDGLAHTPKRGDMRATPSLLHYRATTRHAVAEDAPRFGGGLAVEGDVDYNGGVEIAMFYLDKLYVRKKGGDTVGEQIQRMYITTGYRHWFNPSLSAGAAFFSSYSMGEAKVVLDERHSGQQLATSARDVTEYGFDLSGQWEIWSNDAIAVVTDARYSLSMTHKQHEDADLYGILLGIKYLVPKAG